MRWPLAFGKRELLALFSAFVLSGFIKPWWVFVIVAIVAGALTYRRKARSLVAIAVLSGTSWVAVALLQDTLTLGRISKRLAGVFTMPFPILLYVTMFVMAGAIALFGAMTARFLSQALHFGEKP